MIHAVVTNRKMRMEDGLVVKHLEKYEYNKHSEILNGGYLD
jgi:hypothetical protein